MQGHAGRNGDWARHCGAGAGAPTVLKARSARGSGFQWCEVGYNGSLVGRRA